VLNAFRHHGIGHIAGVMVKGQTLYTCSTPSGIMESVTIGRGVDRLRLTSVLNAFRHHGIGHL